MQASATANTATYASTVNPAHLIETWQLGNGRTATLRPVLPQDDRLEQSFVKSLSLESRRNRFHSAVNGLSEAPQRFGRHLAKHFHTVFVTLLDDLVVLVPR